MGLNATGRLIIVSNRLPVTVETAENRIQIAPASGGLATGLRRPHEQSPDALWIGWPGEMLRLNKRRRHELDRMLAEQRIVPLYLSHSEVEGFYHEFSNGVLWPLFHYQLDRVPNDARYWDTYRAVNARYADLVAEHYRPGDRIWVHDYQLLCLPGMIRERIPDARIGFFLHIPFPDSDVFRSLPWRAEVLNGLLGANLIGFHTFSYLRHFTSSLLEILGLEPEADEIWQGEHTARLGVFPMGIDAAGFDRLGSDPEVVADAEAIRRDAGGRHILLGIDRLDYTKGLPRRLLAFQRLLDKHPELRGRVRLIQVAVPSRTKVREYREYRSQVETLVGRINGAHTTVDDVPIHYLYRAVPDRQLAALYRAADVMLVTPLRDGMNLVAKEFVATRTDGDGVLLLSEFAGAASELGEALRVNPYDVDGMAQAMKHALEMPESERRTRIRALRRRVRDADVHAWVHQFLDSLSRPRPEEDRTHQPPTPAVRIHSLIGDLKSAPRLILILDYDGTLVPIEDAPELATPDRDVVELLRALSQRGGTTVHVASGRTRGTLDRWFGGLDLHLWSEHGYWHRPPGCAKWTSLFDTPPDWADRIRPVLDQFTARTPGSLVEEKTSAMAWHYRMAEPEFGSLQARRLRAHLAHILHNAPFEVILGNKVVEIRLQGVNKGRVAAAVKGELTDGRVVAIGDDMTDEDLFAALPEDAVSIHVGPEPSVAGYRVQDVRAVRRILRRLLEG